MEMMGTHLRVLGCFEYLSGCILFIHVEGAGVQKIILTSIMGMDGQGPKMVLDQYQPGD